MGLIKKLRKAKKEAPPNEKPAVVKTHLRDMIIVPEMIGSVVGIYNGKVSVIHDRGKLRLEEERKGLPDGLCVSGFEMNSYSPVPFTSDWSIRGPWLRPLAFLPSCQFSSSDCSLLGLQLC